VAGGARDPLTAGNGAPLNPSYKFEEEEWEDERLEDEEREQNLPKFIHKSIPAQ
jgi:hypothetical protein